MKTQPYLHRSLGQQMHDLAEHADTTAEPDPQFNRYVPERELQRAINFWKPKYFHHSVEGRMINGIEAYELGDPKKTLRPDQVPYIAMCNLMALEALRMLGPQAPTVEHSIQLHLGSPREREIAGFWKDNFAPTRFQADWAWYAVRAVKSGEPGSYQELLVAYADQMP